MNYLSMFWRADKGINIVALSSATINSNNISISLFLWEN